MGRNPLVIIILPLRVIILLEVAAVAEFVLWFLPKVEEGEFRMIDLK